MRTINGKDFTREQEDAEIDRLHKLGKNARVQYPDGALWLYCADGRCLKLNNM